jgi:hypothetical protein
LREGIQDFGKNAGVKADQLPTEQKSTEIKKEIEALPPLGWLRNDDFTPRYRAPAGRYLSVPSDDAAWMAYAARQGQTPLTLRAPADRPIQAGEGAYIIPPESDETGV